MENILEMLCNLPREKIHAQDSPFVRTARIKSENLELLIMAELMEGRWDVL